MISQKNKHFLLTTGLLIILFIIFHIWLLPRFDVSDINKGIYSLDLRSSYTKETVIQLFNSIGENGIAQYKKFLIVDYAYLLVYGSLTFFTLKFLLNHMGRLAIKLKHTVWFPLIVMILDIIENINTYFLLQNHLEISELAVQFGSVITTSKWMAVAISFGMMICYAFYGILRNIFWKLKKKESTLSK